MKTCDCHVPPREATHRLPSGRLLCALEAERVTARWEREVGVRIPQPLSAQPALFSEETKP